MFSKLQNVWQAVEQRFMTSPPIQRLRHGDLRLAHYASYLRETYFYTREDSQIQALCTAWFRGSDREMVKPFLQHAMSEIGHDQMALDDLRSLGFDTDAIPRENPLTTRQAKVPSPALLRRLSFLIRFTTRRATRVRSASFISRPDHRARNVQSSRGHPMTL